MLKVPPNDSVITYSTQELYIISINRSRGEMSKRLGGIIGCKYKTSSWHVNGFPDGSNIGSTVYHVGEKPTVMMYTYINCHAGTSDIKQNILFLAHTEICLQ